jgi:hypothetical protein
MYLSHIRIKSNGTGDIYHSEMVSGIDYSRDSAGKITGVNSISAANPWRGDGNSSFTAKTSYTMNQIGRFDVFRVTPTLKYYKNHFGYTMLDQ